MNTALLKLYAETNSPELIPLIAGTASSSNPFDSPTTPQPLGSIAECAEYLEQYERHHARALLYRCHGDAGRALGVWVQLADGKLNDDLFPGLPFVAEYLAKYVKYNCQCQRLLTKSTFALFLVHFRISTTCSFKPLLVLGR